MAITASVTGQQITASVGESVIDVTVSGGIGPSGPVGPSGATTWVGITDRPTEFSPTAHASRHAIGGVDYLSPAAIGAATISAAESLQTQVNGKASNNHSHDASAITSGTINVVRLPGVALGDHYHTADRINFGTLNIARIPLGTTSSTVCVGNDSRLTDSREWSAATVTQAEAEAGTSSDRRAFTPLRVLQAIAAWWGGSSAKAKLDGVADGATANATDAQLRDRSTHTGTQLASTISDFTAAVVEAAPPTTNASLLTSGTISSLRLPLATTTTRGAVRLGDGFIVHPTTGAISVSTDYAATGHSHAIADVTGLQAALDGKQAAGSYAAAVHSHTIQEVIDLESELNARITVDDHRLEDAREWSAATVTQADAEAGTSTTRVAFTPLRVFQAVAAWWSGVSVPWAKLTDVPATFTPSSHTHDASAITAGTLAAARLPASVVQRDVVGGISVGAAYITYPTIPEDPAELDLLQVAVPHSATSAPSVFMVRGDGLVTCNGLAVTGTVTTSAGISIGDPNLILYNDGNALTVDSPSGPALYCDGNSCTVWGTLYPISGVTFPDSTTQTTAWTGSVAASAVTSGTLDIARIPTGTASTTVALGSHTHGNLTSTGSLGSASGLVVVTGASGAVGTLAQGTAGQVLKVNSTATGVEWGTAGAAAAVDVRSDTVGATTYTGRAAAGSATSASVWTIRRTVLTSAGAVSSTATATNVRWDDRLTATYS